MAINIEWQVKPPSKVRRKSERRSELVRTIPSEEEEDEVKTYKERCRGERVKDNSFCFWAKCSNSTENCN